MITIVVQGQVYPWTKEFIEKYKKFRLVDEVIFSTWIGENIEETCYTIYNSKPINEGIGNRNLQIVSSNAGIQKVKTRYTLKVRSDMFLPHLNEMINFSLPKIIQDEIFVLSIYPKFPFHPRDHVFFGLTDSVQKLFTIPLDKEAKKPYDETKDIRSETYIGMWYYAKENPKIYDYINQPKKYITDDAPNRDEALQIYREMIRRKQCFIPFPKFNIYWPKYYPTGYPFEYLKSIYHDCYYEDLHVL